MKRYFVIPWIIFLFVLASPALAEEKVCAKAKFLEDCFEEGYASVAKEVATEVTSKMGDEADAAVRAEATNTVADSSTQGASLNNFLSPFLILVDSGELDGEGKKLAIETAVKALDDLDKDVKLQVVFNEAKLFDPLKTQLTEGMMGDRATTLEKTLEDIDDLTFNLSWSLVNEKFGRSIEHHRGWMGDLYGQVAAQTFDFVGSTEKERKRLEMFTVLGNRCPNSDPSDQSVLDFECLKKNEDNLQTIFDAGRELATLNNTFRETLEGHKLPQFEKLLNNQPQLIVTGSYTDRDDLAGPDELSASFTFEKGIVNINTMKKACAKETESDRRLQCYTNYLENPVRQSSIKANNRLAFKVEYKDIDDLSLMIPGDEAAMTEEILFAQTGSTSWNASLTYGRYLWVQGEESARIDLSVTGKWVDNDTMEMPTDMMMVGEAMKRQDQVVASLMYTQRLNDQTGAVLGFSWANEPEFLGDVTEKIGVRAGLTYKILGGKKKNGS